MLRALALAAFLLLTLLWTVTAWAEPANSTTLLQVTRVAVAGGSAITVTTTTDEVNNDGDCSLREAIESAISDMATDSCAAGNGGDTVVLPAGTYSLTLK
jgi:CSLREA domain-containing protein